MDDPSRRPWKTNCVRTATDAVASERRRRLGRDHVTEKCPQPSASDAVVYVAARKTRGRVGAEVAVRAGDPSSAGTTGRIDGRHDKTSPLRFRIRYGECWLRRMDRLNSRAGP